MSDAVSYVQTGVTLSPLDQADVRVVDVGPLGQRFLREPNRLPVLPDDSTECGGNGAIGHRDPKMAVAAT